MKQFLLPREPDSRGNLFLSPDEAHHLVRVRRYQPSTTLDCRTPSGTSITMIGQPRPDGSLELHRLDRANDQNPNATSLVPRIHIIQALPKAAKMDLIIRQATEAGASSLTPFKAERSIPELGDRAADRLDRWRRIAREAYQQSGADQLLEIGEPADLTAALASLESRAEAPIRILYCHETALAQGTLHEYLGDRPSDLALVIGPEGGLAPGELRRLQTVALPLYLGPGVLRTETVALFCIAAIRMISWEANSWELRPH